MDSTIHLPGEGNHTSRTPSVFGTIPVFQRPAMRENLTREHIRYDVGMGGCYYLSDVEENGAGIHVIRGGHKMAEEIFFSEEDGLERFENWRNIDDLAPSMEVTADAGDFVLGRSDD